MCNSVAYNKSVHKKDLLNLLERSQAPISVPEILKIIPANKTTIYRELESFLNDGKVAEVTFGDGKKRFELVKDHHHHLICEGCGKVEDIEIDENYLLHDINKKSKFKVIKHSIEFFGLCPKCK